MYIRLYMYCTNPATIGRVLIDTDENKKAYTEQHANVNILIQIGKECYYAKP